jgi:3-hydroxyisobutyrate dehydrogenase-like beta-hydroxyacid dehydrogenase
VLLSICPPLAAVELAQSLAGYQGVYVDANAIAPQTAEEVAEIVTSAGASFVDGGIIGPPPREAGRTRLYLSGAGAGELAPRLATALLDVIALDGTPTAASALKMTFAGWSKGYAALLLTIRAAARQLGVEGALLAQWRQSQPDLVELSERLAAETSTKAWRWTGEMDEIALTLASSGLPSGFHEAASEVYRRMGSDLDPQDPELLARLLEALADPPARTSAG